MNTAKSETAACINVQERILKIQTEAGHTPDFLNGAVMKNKILLVDLKASNLQVYNHFDGRRIFTSDKLDEPNDVCVISDTEIAVCLRWGGIVVMSLDSIDVVKQVKKFKVRAEYSFNFHSVAKWRSDELIVSGWNFHGNTFFWGLVSVKDTKFVLTRNICNLPWFFELVAQYTHVAVKQNTVYVSCPTGEAITTGVYAFDVLNLNHKQKFVYQHKDLVPGSILTESKYVFVCNKASDTIHQVSDTGQVLKIHKLSPYKRATLYSLDSNVLTSYTMEYIHQADADETVHNIHVMVLGPMFAGKSTLVKHIFGQDQNIYMRHGTDGIDAICCDVSLSTGAWTMESKVGQRKPNRSEVCLTIWDFPSRYSLNTKHLTFLTKRAIYLFVFDLSDHKGMPDKVHEFIDVGLNSMRPSARGDRPHVILVGTHMDKLLQDKNPENATNPKDKSPIEEICKTYFKKTRSYFEDKFEVIAEFFYIDYTVRENKVEDLKKKIVQVASEQPYWKEKTPVQWLPLEQELMRRKANGEKEISYDDVKKIAKPETEVDLIIKYLTTNGTIISDSSKAPSRKIALDPTWINDAMESLKKHISDMETNLSSSTNSFMTKKSDLSETGILTSELIDSLWTKERYPGLHDNKDYVLEKMEQLNIIATPRKFSEMGETTMDYYIAPCVIRKESPKECISHKQDSVIVSTPVLRFVFAEECFSPSIFHNLITACLKRWPVGKMDTSKNLIFCDCCIFDLGLFHRLILHRENHVLFARITWPVNDEVKLPDAKLCSRVKRFIMLNLNKITPELDQKLKYELFSWWSPSKPFSEDGSAASFHMWCEDEVYDTDSPISREHMNHARLCLVFVTICGNAMREILQTHHQSNHTDIYQAILAQKGKLTGKKGRSLLSSDQINLVFPDPLGQTIGKVEDFDITLLYTLIRNVSNVPAPKSCWGNNPQPNDHSLGASVERIRIYRNDIVGHSSDGKIKQKKFNEYWSNIDSVLQDIEHELGKQGYREQLERQRIQVITVYEA